MGRLIKKKKRSLKCGPQTLSCNINSNILHQLTCKVSSGNLRIVSVQMDSKHRYAIWCARHASG